MMGFSARCIFQMGLGLAALGVLLSTPAKAISAETKLGWQYTPSKILWGMNTPIILSKQKATGNYLSFSCIKGNFLLGFNLKLLPYAAEQSSVFSFFPSRGKHKLFVQTARSSIAFEIVTVRGPDNVSGMLATSTVKQSNLLKTLLNDFPNQNGFIKLAVNTQKEGRKIATMSFKTDNSIGLVLRFLRECEALK